jgi:hypothetical protein
VKPRRLVASLLLSAAFLYLFLRTFDLEAAWLSLRAADPALIGLALLANLATFLIRAWRWRWLLAPVRRGIGMDSLVSATFIGFMVSFVVPFRLGEIVRPALLARRERLRWSAALGTVALERILDLMTLLALFLLFMLSARGAALMTGSGDGTGGQAAALLRRGGWVAGAVVLAALPALTLLVAFPGEVVRRLRRWHGGRGPGPVHRAIGTLETFVEGLGVVRRGRELLVCVALSVLHWGVAGAMLYAGVSAFAAPLEFGDSFLLLIPLSIGIAMPTPGGVGPYEYLAQVSLTGFWGVDAPRAAAMAITLHALTILPAIVAGLGFMWRDGLRPGEMRRMAARVGTPSRGEAAR